MGCQKNYCIVVIGKMGYIGDVGVLKELLHQDMTTISWVVRYGAVSGAKRLNMRTSPPLTHPTHCFINDQNKKNSVKFWLIPILDRIISCHSQEP